MSCRESTGQHIVVTAVTTVLNGRERVDFPRSMTGDVKHVCDVFFSVGDAVDWRARVGAHFGC